MIKSKKGQGLSMNTIVLIIIAVLVLLVIIVIFMGGATAVNQWFKEVFNFGTASQSRGFVETACNSNCDSAEDSDNSANTAYCNYIFENVDANGDGEPDGDYVCDSSNTAVDITENKIKSGKFGADCNADCGA